MYIIFLSKQRIKNKRSKLKSKSSTTVSYSSRTFVFEKYAKEGKTLKIIKKTLTIRKKK